MKIYNPITEKIEDLKLKNPKQLNMYVCGPTVYNDLHIGNMRTVIMFDLLARFMDYQGIKINYISNLTDVDDKIINKAQELGITEVELSTKYINNFFVLLKAFNIKYPNKFLKATDYIDNMNKDITSLVKNSHAYFSDGNVFFKVNDFIKEYGLISKQNTTELLASNVSNKESSLDFAIWKNTSVGIKYHSPYGDGRPGWHTECSAMINHYFKDTIDIHGGGMDLKFPHHENENIQFVALNNKRIANYFIYVGMLDFNNQKMSKSLGNIILAKDLIKDYHPYSFKLLLYAHLYRQKINFSLDLLKQYEKEYLKIKRTIKSKMLTLAYNNIDPNKLDQSFITKVSNHLQNDFNTALMVSDILEYVKLINKEVDLNKLAMMIKTIKYLLELIGIPEDYEPSTEVVKLYTLWLKYRADKNYLEADKIKKELVIKGALDE